MTRIYFNHTLEELRALVLKHANAPGVLGPIHDELTFRETDGAVKLRREVLGLLRGEVSPPPKQDLPDVPENQRPLF